MTQHSSCPRRSYVAEAFRLAWPADYKGARLIVALTAYLDASWTSSAVTVAGYVSDVDRWASFETEWQDVLTGYGIEYFHMKDFAAREGDYKSWGPKGDCRLVRLLEIINASVLAAVSITVPLGLWRAVLSDEERERSGNPYCIAGFGCFREITRWMRRECGAGDEVAYVYDQGDKGRGEIFKLFNAVYDSQDLRREYRLLSMKVEDKKRFVPLQAADILAWERNREVPKGLGLDAMPSKCSMPIGGWMDTFLATLDIDGSAEWYRRSLNQFQEPSDPKVECCRRD